MRLVIPYALFWARNDAMHSESPHDEVANSEKPWELFENQNTKKKKKKKKKASTNKSLPRRAHAQRETPNCCKITEKIGNEMKEHTYNRRSCAVEKRVEPCENLYPCFLFFLSLRHLSPVWRC
jgi:hypothetical protein